MTITPECSPLDHWRQMLRGRHRCRAQPRPLAAVGYLAQGPVIQGLIEIEKLTLVLLYDEPTDKGRIALRLAGYSAVVFPGVSASAAPSSAGSSKIFPSSPFHRPEGTGSIWPARNCFRWG